ncbi:hypothetical protein SAMN04489737_0575 [Arcanobacterium phocae]|uniref:Uncharacterized protein n=1 Tax=Arcanobacterium phocae TaxID=131112 RepID=A0A1H2LCE1_9ACTO|nr:hypothetical protein [Arcanobacterium phocae]SDU78687.1 hypothetical protein SAMN04489737_0575 [Arcanobacterium phocae]
MRLVPNTDTTREIASVTASAQGATLEVDNQQMVLTWEQAQAVYNMLADLLPDYLVMGGDVA